MKAQQPDAVDLLALVERAYPGWLGFDDPRYLKEEREYKVAAADLARELLGEEALGNLVSTGDYDEVVDRVRKVTQATNLLYLRNPSSGDTAVLEREELSNRQRAELIFDLLHGSGPTPERLDRYRETVELAGLRPSWPLPTYLLFLMHPEEEVFVKPGLTRRLLKELPTVGGRAYTTSGPGYRSVVNSATYRELQQVYQWLYETLDQLGHGPSDMIDVQGFVWIAYDKGDPMGPLGWLEERVPVHPDDPAEVDELGRRPFAQVLAQRIRQIYDSLGGPATFAVHLHGPWGAGKTSVLNFLRDELRQGDPEAPKPPWLVVDFNAWRQQRIRPPWWPFIRQVYEQAVAQLPWRARWRPRLKWWWWRLKTSWLPVLLTLLTIGLTVAFLAFLTGGGEGPAFDVKEAITLLLAILSLGATLHTIHQSLLLGSAKAAQTYLEMRSDPLGPLSKLFDRLTRSFGRPLAIFVDDLDRCDAGYVVDLLEGVQTLFREAPVVYVIAADRKWIQTSFELRYTDFSAADLGGPGRPLGHLFLEKMFQISVALPRLSPDARQEYWRGLIETGAGRPTEAAQKAMKKRGAEELRDAKSPQEIQRVVEQSRDSVIEAGVRMAAAERLSTPESVRATAHFLAPYATLLEPNPRSMKRLVNAFGLQQSINLLAHVDAPLGPLALWTILQQRWPELADLLARHPELVVSLGGGGALGEKETRVPERLRELFGRESVRQVVAAEGRDARLEEAVLRRLVG